MGASLSAWKTLEGEYLNDWQKCALSILYDVCLDLVKRKQFFNFILELLYEFP